MKKKLTSIFILITVAMLGIVYFQVDWIHKTYKAEVRKINNNANNVLDYALMRYHNDHSDSVVKALFPHLSSLYDSVKITTRGTDNYNYSDSLLITLENKYLKSNKTEIKRRRVSYTIGRIKITTPSIEYIKGKPISGKPNENAQKVIQDLIPPIDQSCNLLYIKSDSIKIAKYFKEGLINRGMGDLNERIDLVFYCWSSVQFRDIQPLGTSIMEYRPQGIQAYVGTKRWVKAYFTNHDVMVLSQMIGPSILSIVSLLITIFSFIYLLILILKQKRLAEMKDDFINNMTHELKTPIAIISAAVEGMQNFNVLQDKEKTNRYLETSRKELNRLNDLVTKVLHMASYEKKDIELSLSKIGINELINDVIETFKSYADKTLDITFYNTSSIEYIHADPIHFRNVISNLIDNAIKYSGTKAEITISCSSNEKQIRFSVIDKGIGIPDLQLDQIFEKFHRVPTGNIHNVKGTGLGLSYVRYIVGMHGGTVTVKSEPGKGSEFIISLPYKA